MHPPSPPLPLTNIYFNRLRLHGVPKPACNWCNCLLHFATERHIHAFLSPVLSCFHSSFFKLDWHQYLCWEPYIHTKEKSYTNWLYWWFTLLFLSTILLSCHSPKRERCRLTEAIKRKRSLQITWHFPQQSKHSH